MRPRILAEDPKPDYLWCLHCEQAYPYGKYRQGRLVQLCPYTGCDGSTISDAWGWSKIKDARPEYPDTPEEGITYPLY